MPRVLIEALVAAPFGPLRVMTTHLEYSSAKLRDAQVTGIREAHRTASARVKQPPKAYYGPFIPQTRSRSAILTGDFNMKASDPIKARIEAPVPGAESLVDAWHLKHGETPHPPSFCLFDQRYGAPHCCDFIFVTEDLAPRVTHIHYDIGTKASDHQPVLIELAGEA
jgi:endonuclease/exonuclease/phosphatase family metal-dependent hydrolase